MATPGHGGEVVESIEGVVKATKAPRFGKDTHIDRPSRHSSTPPASHHEQEHNTTTATTMAYHRESRTRSRSRSRSPYRYHRGEKRTMADDHYSRNSQNKRHFNSRFDGSSSFKDRRPVSYADIDKDQNSAYRSSRNGQKDRDRDRNRSRSPYRHGRDRSRSPFRHGRAAEDGSDVNQREYKQSLSTPGVQESGESQVKNEVVSQVNPSASTTIRGAPKFVIGNAGNPTKSKFAGAFINSTAQDAIKRQDGGTKPSTNGASSDTITRDADADEVNEAVPQPIDEDALIEQRRKQREAIKAKYKTNVSAPPTPLLVQALEAATVPNRSTPEAQTPSTEPHCARSSSTISSHTSAVTPQVESTVGSAFGSPQVDSELPSVSQSPANNTGISAANYNPLADMESRLRLETKRAQRESDSSIGIKDLVPRIVNKEAEDSDDDDFDMFTDKPTEEKKPKKNRGKATGKVLKASMQDNWDDPDLYYRMIPNELVNGHYIIQHFLGQGMFASVVRAEDTREDGKLVAIKIVRNNDVMRKAGQREMKMLQKLNEADPNDTHNIVRLLEVFNHKHHLCMVFENMNTDLRSFLKEYGSKIGLPLYAVRSYANSMFKALALFKKCNILHADLKPDNILADNQHNKIKIADFGSAFDNADSEVNSEVVSRFYRAPEVIMEMKPSFPMDMWAIGCTLFELHDSNILFTGHNDNQMIEQMMACRGKLSKRMIKRASPNFQVVNFDSHFDQFRSFYDMHNPNTYRMVNFRSDPVHRKDIGYRVRAAARAKKVTPEVMEQTKAFIDLLEKCLKLDPEERITPEDALNHPFLHPHRPQVLPVPVRPVSHQSTIKRPAIKKPAVKKPVPAFR